MPSHGDAAHVAEAASGSIIRELFDFAALDHPAIEMNPAILGGIPRIKGTRLSVGQILGRLYILGSAEAVAEYYEQDVTAEQVREALAFAQDFVEYAGDPTKALGRS
jgi:uncharacterized protein (DUF433 family)